MASNMDWSELNTFINDKFSNSDTSIDQSKHHNAFRQQLNSYPDDTNFIVDLVDRSITCMEEENFTPIPFNFDASGAIDFTSFREHIENSEHSEKHASRRDARLRKVRRKLLAQRATVKQEDVKPVLDLAISRKASPELKPAIDVKPALDSAPSPSLAGASSSSHKRKTKPSTSLRKPKKKIKVIDLTNSSPELSPTASPAPQPLTALDLRQQLAQSQLDSLDEQKDALRQTIAQIQSERDQQSQNQTKRSVPVPVEVEAAREAVTGPGPATIALAQRNAAPAVEDASSVASDESEVDDAIMADVSQSSDDDDDGLEVALEEKPAEDELDAALREAANGEVFDDSATVDDAARKLGLSSQHDLIDNLTVRLMPHQLIGVAWMLEKEKSDTHGGIVGDEMGLGKTIQMIALMAKHQSKNKKRKTTLIVVPLSLLAQWQRELHERTEDDYFSVLVYRGDGRKTNSTPTQLGHFDVILTTYGVLIEELNEAEAEEDDEKTGAQVGKAHGKAKRSRGLLFAVKWYRVVIDEAHTIRNSAAKTSRAVVKLEGKFKWVMTGTLIINKHDDVYPLFEFLRFNPWSDRSYSRPQIRPTKKRTAYQLKDRSAQLHSALLSVLLRRKKDSEVNGKKLLVLPRKKVKTRELEFSAEERNAYDQVEEQARRNSTRDLSGKVVGVQVFSLLMDVRRISIHVALGLHAYNAERERKLKSDALARAATAIGEESADKLKKIAFDRAIERLEAEQAGDMRAYAGREDCPICFESATDAEGGAVITRCGHVFCKPCLDKILSSQSAGPAQPGSATGERSCPVCRRPISTEEVFTLAAFEPHYDEIRETRPDLASPLSTSLIDFAEDPIDDFLASDGEVETEDDWDDSEPELVGDVDQQRVTRKQGRELAGPKPPKRRNKQAIVESDEEKPLQPERRLNAEERRKAKKRAKAMLKRQRDEEKRWWLSRQPPSTKMRWTLAKIKQIDDEFPDDKVIIMSQWTSVLDMMAAYLARNGFEFGRYQGDMSADERDSSVHEFMTEPNPKVMLLSLKCGGVGLNLTRANRVILLEPAYSPATEAQAFDRVHRIGQDKEVFVDRLIIKNTIEGRIDILQATKQFISDSTLGEANGREFTADEIGYLLGFKVKAAPRHGV